MNIERRYVPIASDAECLAVEERADGAPRLVGISPPWRSPSLDLGGFREVFLPTAFDRVLASPGLDVPFLFNHDDSRLLARTTNGSLRLAKTERGLGYDATLVDTPTASEVLTLVRSRAIFGSSFAFTVASAGESWSEDESGELTRTISEASGLFDVSAVTRAAYPASTVSARAIAAYREARQTVGHADRPQGLTISLDYDGTFTAAPALWRAFVADAISRGHRVACITRREDTEQNVEELRLAFGELYPELAAVILCGPNRQKRCAADELGLAVDIWIDDSPEKIPAAEPRSSVRPLSLAGARASAAAAVARMRSHEHSS
jgi:HK97 family phage prohead protease